jgi:pumilio family protein 6
MFNVLEAKDRKTVLKSIKETLNEMMTNKIAHLFIIHILMSLDDTVVTKKKIINEMVLVVDEQISDKCFQNILLALFSNLHKKYFSAEDLEPIQSALTENTTSKKPSHVRRQELLQYTITPMDKFFEEKLAFYLTDIAQMPLLKEVLLAIIELGKVESSDLIDELLRQV